MSVSINSNGINVLKSHFYYFSIRYKNTIRAIKDRDHEELLLASPKLPCCGAPSKHPLICNVLFMFLYANFEMTNNYTDNNKGLKVKNIPGIINRKRMVEMNVKCKLNSSNRCHLGRLV